MADRVICHHLALPYLRKKKSPYFINSLKMNTE